MYVKGVVVVKGGWSGNISLDEKLLKRLLLHLVIQKKISWHLEKIIFPMGGYFDGNVHAPPKNLQSAMLALGVRLAGHA